MVNFQIYTMFVNRRDLLVEAIQSLGVYGDKLVVLDNSPAQELRLEDFTGEIFRPTVPLFCNQSYNLIARLAKERFQDAFFIMHSDARTSPEVITQLLQRADQLNREARRWGVMFTDYDVLCLSNVRTVGDYQWDPYLPLYYTDVDYYYRLQLAGIELVETHLPVEHQEGGSATQHADPALRTFIQTNYPAWRHYYITKWGGDRGEERYRTPFNR